MQSKHTPGTWHTQSRSMCDNSLVVTADGGKEICLVRDRTLRDYSAEDREDMANSRLISAAPELLEALNALVSLAEGRWARPAFDSREPIDLARAAIAKTEPETETSVLAHR